MIIIARRGCGLGEAHQLAQALVHHLVVAAEEGAEELVDGVGCLFRVQDLRVMELQLHDVVHAELRDVHLQFWLIIVVIDLSRCLCVVY